MLLGKLRPHLPPVVRTQVDPRDLAPGGHLNLNGSLKRHGPLAVSPLGNELWGHIEAAREFRPSPTDLKVVG